MDSQNSEKVAHVIIWITWAALLLMLLWCADSVLTAVLCQQFITLCTVSADIYVYAVFLLKKKAASLFWAHHYVKVEQKPLKFVKIIPEWPTMGDNTLWIVSLEYNSKP